MIATQRFVYVHLHKSGGSFINQCLMRFFPGAQQLGYHLPLHLMPAALGHLPVLGFVRNPWSYYVSWYSFQSQLRQPNALFLCMSEGRALGFRGTVTNLLNLGSSDAKLDELQQQLPERYTGQGLNLPRFALEPIRGSGLGFYSHLYRHMFAGGGNRLFIGRNESLRQDLLRFVETTEGTVPPGMREFIMTSAEVNVSRHRPYASYYDENLRELILRRDGELIRTYGYAFAGEP